MTIMPALPQRSLTTWDDLDADTKAYIKRECERDHLFFTQAMFKERQGSKFLVGPHHRLIGNAVDRVLSGEINRLIVSVPPGYTKTEEVVIAFIARGMAKTNGRAKFIHSSFSDVLVKENSNAVKDTMMSEAYQEMWPGLEPRKDSKATDRWKTDQGGGMLAKQAAGPITGFRAGLMEPGFTGALVIDDPLKPDDAFTIEREKINKRWHTTFKSRLAVETVPVIVIMQRIHADDFAGYLLKGGANCMWHHLMLPVWIDPNAEYPSEFTHGIPIEHDLPEGPLWREKHDEAAIEILKADDFTFQAQYMQRPIAVGGNLFKEEWLAHDYDPDDTGLSFEWRAIYADTAQKAGNKNDYSVFQCWGRAAVSGQAYLIDQIRGKWEAPELLVMAETFWNKHANPVAYPGHRYGALRAMNVEDKVSGTGLIQTIQRKGIPILPITRGPDQNKITRAKDVLPSFAAGLVRLPAASKTPWRGEYNRELLSFTGMGDTNDDQVDPTCDAVAEICTNAVSYAAIA